MRMFVVLLSLYFLTIKSEDVAFNASNVEHGEEWLSWKGIFNKLYSTMDEEKQRYLVWLQNKRYIDNHNKQPGNLNFTLRMNHFGDMTLDEFSEAYSCHFITELSKHSNSGLFTKAKQYAHPQSESFPTSIDWRRMKAVTNIKAQGEYRCHSCYAFAAVGALESHHAIASGSRVRLSEQNVIDCSSQYGNNGCQGGNYKSAYAYIIKNGGISKQYNYRYKAKKGNCRFSSSYIGATMKDVKYIKSGSEEDLTSAVGLKGPVVVAIDHKHQSFQFYGGGLYSESSCSSNYYLLSHEMVAIGYGTNNAGYDFWTLRNSYGSSWGNGGYMRMLRNVNMCGVATDAGFPVV